MTAAIMAELRAYARGYLAGLCLGALDESEAYRREAVALVALRELGVSAVGAKGILVQARDDAHLAVPDLTEFGGRLVAANMVIAILRQRIASQFDALHPETKHGGAPGAGRGKKSPPKDATVGSLGAPSFAEDTARKVVPA